MGGAGGDAPVGDEVNQGPDAAAGPTVAGQGDQTGIYTEKVVVVQIPPPSVAFG